MSYPYHVVLERGSYKVAIHCDDIYRGHFERDGEAIGQLWFERLANGDIALSDYDGVFLLPRAVAALLRSHGYIVTPDFD